MPTKHCGVCSTMLPDDTVNVELCARCKQLSMSERLALMDTQGLRPNDKQRRLK